MEEKRDEITRLSEELEGALDGLAGQEARTDRQSERRARLVRQMYGASSEEDDGQKEQAAAEFEPLNPAPRTRRKKPKRSRREWETEAGKSENVGETEDVPRVFRPSDGLWAAFLVPVVVMVIIFIQRGIFPFGDETFLRTDMYHQYAPFFSEFQYKLQNGGSLLYSWNIGMGVNFSALYAYYLASPLNWFLILVPKAYVIEFMTYSIVLKIGLSGLAFAWYLRKHSGRRDFGAAFFGIFYALSGYMAAYSWNIMWLDCILLFPIIMLGLERLVKEKRGLLYAVALGFSILSNYYISIMICIFMVLYFVALLILEGGRKKKAGDYMTAVGQFGFYSLMAGGLAAVVLLPEIYALQTTASGDFNFPQTVSSYFSIFDMFARHIGNVEIEIGLDHWPNIYCGVAVLLFFLLYLGSKKIPVREKTVYVGLLLLFYASFSVNVLNFIWHGFHYPNSLPCRQSFIYIFLMLVICYRAYSFLKETPWRHIAWAFFGAYGFVVMAEKLVEQEHFQFWMFYVALLFLAMYGGLLYLYKKGRSLNTVLILALMLVSVEAAVNTTVTSVTTTGRSAYLKDNGEVKALTDSLQPSDTFYRIEKVTRKTKNDGAWMNFPSVSLFSSTASADLTAFFKSVGCEGNTNAYSITGSTPLVDSLFSLRYGLYSEAQPDNDLLMLMGQEGGTYLYMRRYTLPVGFMMDEDLNANWKRDFGNPAVNQNDLCSLLGTAPVLVDAGGMNSGNTFRFTPERTGDYYVYVTNRSVEQVDVQKGVESRTVKNINRGFLVELGICEAGQEIVLTGGEDDGDLAAKAYYFDGNALAQVYETLGAEPLTVTRWTDTRLEGQVQAARDGILFTSIPYDKGWTVLVDGQKAEPEKIFDAFLGVPVREGLHTVSYSYEPQGLRLGAFVSGGCILLLFFTAFIGYFLRKRNRKEETAPDEEIGYLDDEMEFTEENYLDEYYDAEGDENDEIMGRTLHERRK